MAVDLEHATCICMYSWCLQHVYYSNRQTCVHHDTSCQQTIGQLHLMAGRLTHLNMLRHLHSTQVTYNGQDRLRLQEKQVQHVQVTLNHADTG